MSQEYVLVSWVSFGNDPYEREKSGQYREDKGQRVPGPTLELLTNEHSEYRGRIRRACFFVREGLAQEKQREIHGRERDVLRELRQALKEHLPGFEVRERPWQTSAAPTDHRALMLFTANALSWVREQYPEARLVINLSPGTPAMQTVMLLCLQAGIAGSNVEVVQGVPRDKRTSSRDVLTKLPVNLLAELHADVARRARGKPRLWSLAQAESKPLQEVVRLVEQFAATPFPVLIFGERGSGKSRVAGHLRNRHLELQARASSEWKHRINCAAIPESLAESILFGHEKGAFSGADKQHKGHLEEAKGDCIFLDELHHLSKPTQAKLLIALEPGAKFHRVGGSEPVEGRFRLIAGSNRTERELKDGRTLHRDLYDRISDLQLRMPSLRECPEDLQGMWKCALWDVCEEVVRGRLNVPEGHVEALTLNLVEAFEHSEHISQRLPRLRLPGNWRDLHGLARRLVSSGLGRGEMLTLRVTKEAVDEQLNRMDLESQEDLPLATRDFADELPAVERCALALRRVAAERAEDPQGFAPLEYEKLTDELKRRLLLAALKVEKSGQSAAGLLGMKVRTFNQHRKDLLGGDSEPES